jgi:hypothetical protein
MGSFTNFMELELLDMVFGGESYTIPSFFYLGLSKTAIDDDGTNITEPDSANGYQRVELTNDMTTWQIAEISEGNGRKVNDIEIEFPEATADWGVIVDFFIADSLTGGNILGYGSLDEQREIIQGDIAKFLRETLIITLD